MRPERRLAALVVLAALAAAALPAATEIPPAPTAFFNDYAGLVPPDRAQALNERLKQFAEETSSQIVVAVFPRLPEDEALEDFTNQVAQAWRVGQEKLDNGAVLFVFKENRKLRIEVGYGLEGALTDALSSRIIREAIAPRFKAGDWAGGLEAGVEAMMAATRGEYQASPRKGSPVAAIVPLVVFCLILIFVIYVSSKASRMQLPHGRTYGRRGSAPWIFSSGDWGGGGGSWGGFGGGGGGGGGGFSGGGGSFGGGGASGDW
jgi:uncharacterized protein